VHREFETNSHLGLVGKAPNSSSHLDRKYDQKKEEELREKHTVKYLIIVPSDIREEKVHDVGITNPSMQGDSWMAPQHPKKPTTIISAPAAMRMYTPTIHTHFIFTSCYTTCVKKKHL